MRRHAPWFPLALAATICSCSTTSPATSTRTPDAQAARITAPSPAEKIGVMAPADATPIALWPEAWNGSFLLLEALPSEKHVAKGEVIARFDAHAIDDEIHENELEVRSAAMRHRGTVEKNRIEAESAASALQQARAGVDRAKRALDGYKSKEIAFAHRSDEIAKSYEEARLDDQLEELAQDEKMYGEDKHVDMTEEIVLKRQRRAIALTKTSNELSRDRASFHVQLDEKLQLESREEAVRAQEESLTRLVKTQEIDRRSREDAETRSAESLAKQNARLEKLKHDRELFELRAPREGVLLHGSLKDYRPGKTAPRWERGNSIATHGDAFLIADPNANAVTFDLDDKERARWKDGATIQVGLIGDDGSRRDGRLEPASFQVRPGNDHNVHEATVRVSGGELPAGRRVSVVLDDGTHEKSASQ